MGTLMKAFTNKVDKYSIIQIGGAILTTVFLILFSTNSMARDSSPTKKTIRIGIAELPVLSENDETGILVNLLKQLASETTEYNIQVKIYPFKRSIYMLSKNKIDVHFPFIYAPNTPEKGLKYSDLTIYKVPFILAINPKSKSFSIDALDPQSIFFQPDLTIVTEFGHSNAFNYPMIENICMKCAINMLARGRVDGVVFAAREIEKIVRDDGLTDIQLDNFKLFDVKFLVKNNDAGKEYEDIITNLLKKMRQRGKLRSAMGKLLNYDVNTKPNKDNFIGDKNLMHSCKEK